MATRINRIKTLASNSTTRLRIVVGHGGLLPDKPRVPPGVYIIFVSKPGHLLAQRMVLEYPHLFNGRYLRRVLRGGIPVTQIQPPPLRIWKKHFYGPGDVYPNLGLNLFNTHLNGTPQPGTQFNFTTGVHTLNNGTKGMYGQTKTLHDIVTHYGAGIYIVSACRTTSERAGPSRSGSGWTQFNRNLSLSGGTQRYVPRMRSTDPALNRNVQNLENAQARYAAYKRLRNANSRGRSTKRRAVPASFAAGMTFTFAPGVNTRPRKRT